MYTKTKNYPRQVLRTMVALQIKYDKIKIVI